MTATAPTVDGVREVLRQVIDPELGIDIVDLGLVYEVRASADDVDVTMTMTTPACPLHEYLTANVEAVVRREFPAIEYVRVRIVWEPRWHPDMMSPEAKQQLGWRG